MRYEIVIVLPLCILQLMSKSLNKWFTLIEVMITIVIMWFLIWLLFEIFVTIWRIAVFVQLNRAVHGELIYVSQTIQNMVDDQNMQLTWLDLSWTWWDTLTNWRKQNLNFADTDFQYQIGTNCTDEANCFLQLYRLELDPDFLWDVESWSVALTDPNMVSIESFAVRTLPYDSPSNYEQIMHKWFRLFLDIRVPQYDETKRWFRVLQQVELFFTMRKYE